MRLKAETVEDYFASISDQKPSSFNKVRSRVQGLMNFARRRGWLRADVVAEVSKRTVPPDQRTMLTDHELVDLAAAATDARDRAYL